MGSGTAGEGPQRTLERVPVTVPRREEARDATPGGPEEYASEKVFISYVGSVNVTSMHAKLKDRIQNEEILTYKEQLNCMQRGKEMGKFINCLHGRRTKDR